jgi:class 3 adenylate cyclase
MLCSSCRKELPERFPYCPFCGAALSEAVSAPAREERKVVTVLFADLVGFTAQAHQLDPEDVRALLSGYHAHLRTELERFGGTVEKFIGDAVMAVFGAPVAHEDDPERAVRAALAIREWAAEQGNELQVRLAVNTGEALVALDARPWEGEGMVAGDVVNVAARLQAGAPLNGVLVGAQTHRATVDVFDFREVEAVAAKGKPDPVPAWEVLGARARIGVDVTRRVSTALVGRARELELLVSTLARVREESAPELVTLVGVPGIGKSRLVFELSRAVDESPDLVGWRQGRSLPYGDGVTFWALAEIVKAEAGILESDSGDRTQEKLHRAVAAGAADAAERAWLERHLRPLAGLADEAGSSAGEAAAAWRRFLEALAAERPLVVVFEDLHWADDQLLDFVDSLAERAGGVPLLLLATARPELLQRRPGWGGGKPNAVTLSLSPLADRDAARLVADVLGRPLLDAPTQEALLARAGGNPLYAEQYARALDERGSLDQLPEAVQGIIAARLDALPEDEKRVLQGAAVIGKVFWLGAVEALVGISRWQAEELLHRLERKEFVQRSRGSSVASEREYAFRHVLIQDAAYGQLPRPVRAKRHRQAAGWIEALGRPDDQAELLAHHYLLALELAEAAGLDRSGLGVLARRALRDAGDRAAALYALESARRFYEAALRLWPEGDPERAELLLRRAAPVAGLADGDPDLLTEAIEALLAAGNVGRAAEAEVMLARSHWMRGRRDLNEEHHRRASELVAGAPASRGSAAVLAGLASAALLTGDVAVGLDLASRAHDLAVELGWRDGEAETLALGGTGRVLLGDRRGLDEIAGAAEIAAETGSLGQLQRARNNLAVAHMLLGDVRAASEARLHAAEVAERIGTEGELRWSWGTLTDHHYRLGSWDEAFRLCDALLAGERHYLSGQAWTVRALMRLARDDAAGAFADAEHALAHARRIEEPQVIYYIVPVCTYVFAERGDRDRATPLAREFLQVLSSRTALDFGVITLPAFAAAARLLHLDADLVQALDGRPASPWLDAARSYAGGDYATAADLLDRIGSLPDEADARLRAAERLHTDGRQQEAEEQRRRAVAFLRSVGAGRYLARSHAPPPADAGRAADAPGRTALP